MPTSSTKIPCLLLLIATLLLSPLTRAAERLSAETEVLFPVLPGGRSGGTSSLGSTQVKRIDGANGSHIALSGGKPVAGAWWFPNHRRLTLQEAQVGVEGAGIVLVAKSAKPVKTEVSIQWRGASAGSGETLHSGPVELSADKLTRITFNVPKPEGTESIGGVLITFAQAGEYEVHRIALTRASAVVIDPIAPSDPRQAGDITVAGQVADGVSGVEVHFMPEKTGVATVEKLAGVAKGRFSVTIKPEELVPGFAYQVSASAQGDPKQASPSQRVFVFPRLSGKQNPRVTRDGWDLVCEGKRFGFIGVNYTRLDLGLGNKADYEVIAHDVLQMKSMGVRVVRMPSNVGLLQPEPGLFPDNPRYAEVMRSHKLDPRYVDQMDYFIQLTGENGIYTVIDWHSLPTDPYRYFVGGVPADKGTGKPGTAISYLAPTKTEGVELDLANPLHLKTLLDAHRWIAAHYKGNPNLLGIEIPHNEPHAKYMAIEANWRRIVDQSAKAVAEGDPDRLTFVMGPSYSHNNLLASDTWLLPDRASGAAPHFYLSNGPVPVRKDAKNFKSPWMAREPVDTFGWAFASALMPLSAADYPFYNGETGKWGHEILLPDNPDGARALLEAQLVQEYAAGMSGRTEWTMWGNKGDFDPYVEIYQKQFTRFAPVFEAGPVNRKLAQVAFVQSMAAAPHANGYNHACVPFAKAALDAHLAPVHYLTDDQFLFMASAELSVGLEQVTESSESLQYKAYVADMRSLDPRAVKLLERLGDNVLWLDSADDLTAEKLAAFLMPKGIAVDTKTPQAIQIIEGPAHLIAYRRLAGDAKSTIHPILRREGAFALVSETGERVFKGTASELAEKGIAIDLPTWSSAIFRIEPAE